MPSFMVLLKSVCLRDFADLHSCMPSRGGTMEVQMYQLKNRLVMIGIHQQQYYACKDHSEMYSKSCGLQRLVIGNCGNSCNLSWKAARHAIRWFRTNRRLPRCLVGLFSICKANVIQFYFQQFSPLSAYGSSGVQTAPSWMTESL